MPRKGQGRRAGSLRADGKYEVNARMPAEVAEMLAEAAHRTGDSYCSILNRGVRLVYLELTAPVGPRPIASVSPLLLQSVEAPANFGPAKRKAAR